MNNKSGIGGNVISTPASGGGAVKGMGEKFSPDMFTGTGNFSVPITVPPGRNGLQPDITLVYSTGNGGSAFGLGWNLSIPGVSRKTNKGIPIYDDDKDVFILSGAEDLIEVKREKFGTPGGYKATFRPRTEGLFARIERYKDEENDFWKVWSKDGLISFYGTPEKSNTPSQYNDPAVCADPAYRSNVFQWLLSKTTDVFGNVIEYTYTRDSRSASALASDPHDWDTLYLSGIRYTDYMDNAETKFLCSVSFMYEERPDPFSSYRSGFEIRTTKRCIKIQTYTHPDDTSLLNKTYHFHYLDRRVSNGELDKEFLPLNSCTLLSRISIEGHDGETSEFMPPLEFTYSRFQPSKRTFEPIGGNDLPPYALSNPGLELVDVFGNGLPDIVQLNGQARYWRNLGNGKFDQPKAFNTMPAGVEFSNPNVQLVDADGDGKLDLLINTPELAGYFPLEHDGLWNRKSFRKYSTTPSFNLADPEVRFLDLDGDGITDVLRNGSRLESFFCHPEKGFYKTVTTEKKQLKGFPNVSFSDPRIKFADMSGDGLQDIVFINDGHIEYWPNLGHGRWGSKVSMKHSPRFPYQHDPARIILGDIDGDGYTDLIYIENNKVTLWINQCGNQWSEAIEITGTPAVYNAGSARLADLKGSGTTGLLWTYDYSGNNRGRNMFYLDFSGAVKPYVLHEMNNFMGAITRVEYKPSTFYYLCDQNGWDAFNLGGYTRVRKPTPWKTTLPFPVQVVAKVEVIDELSQGKLVTQYAYRHGYWDGGEREFRGFGCVIQRDTESFERYNTNSALNPESDFVKVEKVHYSVPTESRSWFHLGPVGDEVGDWKEVDFSDEYWQEDKPVLERPGVMKEMIKALPRRARRDAYRALRGSSLRSELYALDNSVYQDRPYTVSENLQGVRLEYTPGAVQQIALDETNKAGSGYIFFAQGLASRSSSYERGTDPMTSFSFTEEYDAYGNPQTQIGIAIPRGRKFTETESNTSPYLSTIARTVFAHRDDSTHYLIGRPLSGKSYEILNDGKEPVLAFKKRVLEEFTTGPSLNFKLLTFSLSYYDGAAFTGLAYGQLGDYGVPVKSETLVMTEEDIAGIYGDVRPPYLIASVSPGTPTWTSDYPSEFRSALPTNAGYYYHDADSIYEAGYYTIADRKKFDFHVDAGTAKGLVLEMKDPLDNTASVEYDDYKLLPVKVIDPVGMETLASYDYRAMQADQITDPNLNRAQFYFSPLGFVLKSAIMGKSTESLGDTLETPGSVLDYDFFAFYNRRQPVFVKSTARENHVNGGIDNDKTIVTVSYSDGFGRLLQTRTQAEEVIFGDATFGSSGLALPGGSDGDAIGTYNADTSDTDMNVAVSGWQIYNNKGKVVEAYEPYFDQGLSYKTPLQEQKGQKARMFYDPLQRAVRTLNPDNTEQRVLFGVPSDLTRPDHYTPTPWESYSYDANDLAPLHSPPAGSAIASVPSSHHYTPQSSLLDALGRAIQTTDRLAQSGNDVVMKYVYDIRGNLLQVIDPYDRNVFLHEYDFSSRPLKTTHIDSGTRYIVMDCMSKPLEARDEKGALQLSSYDILNRPKSIWARDTEGDDVTKRQYIEYGDELSGTPEDNNLLGKPYKHYDEAGLTIFNSYDFKGNLLEKTRQVISDETLLEIFDGPPTDWEVQAYRVEWTGLDEDILDAKEFTSTLEYDALNRVTKMVYPEDVDSERKELVPSYNRSGALERVLLDGDVYVDRIAYNAKGQKLLMALGSNADGTEGIMTRYLYRNDNFRLLRLKSEKYERETDSATYEKQSGTIKQNYSYEYDLSGNILSIKDTTTDSGYGATPDELIRKFSYDPLYRLLSATGRETEKTETLPWEDVYRPQDETTARGYRQLYTYDKLGNIQELQHIATSGNFTRAFSYLTGKNHLDEITIGMDTYSFSHDVNGNIISEGDTARHLEYDCADQLKSFSVQTGTSEPSKHAQYLYDAGGQRVKKIVWKQGGDYTSTSYIDGAFEYTYDSDLDEEQNVLHIMDGNSRIATIRVGDDLGDTTPEIKFNLEDHLGSSNLLLERNGSLISWEEYYPFGETSFGGYGKKRYSFCGKEKDGESGLYYYGMRYYSPWTCRFVNVDPLADKYAHLAPYAYAANKPINNVDIDGAETPNEATTPGSRGSGGEAPKNTPPVGSPNGSPTSAPQKAVGQKGPSVSATQGKPTGGGSAASSSGASQGRAHGGGTQAKQIGVRTGGTRTAVGYSPGAKGKIPSIGPSWLLLDLLLMTHDAGAPGNPNRNIPVEYAPIDPASIIKPNPAGETGTDLANQYKVTTNPQKQPAPAKQETLVDPFAKPTSTAQPEGDKDSKYDYLYRAMSQEEYKDLAANGFKTLKVNEPGLIFTATNPAYLMDPKSFIHKGGDYDIIVQIRLKKGTLAYLDSISIPEPNSAKKGRAEHVPVRKLEGASYAPSINYGFFTNETITRHLTKNIVGPITTIWKRF